MSRLFEISDGFKELFDSYDSMREDAEESGVPLSEVDKAWFDTLDALEAEFNDKAENVAQYIKEQEARAEALKQEEKRIGARRKTAENAAKSMRAYLIRCMNDMKQNKVDGVRACISLRNNAPSLAVEDEAKTAEYLYQKGQMGLLKIAKPTLDKTKIKDYLKSGEEIPGCSLTRSQSVTIK